MKLKGYHRCCDQWAVEEGTSKRLLVNKLVPFLENSKPKLIKHELISWKGKNDPSTKMDSKYLVCDISFPGVICPTINPHHLPYRMIDGSHRMAKMTLETEIIESYFYVIEPDIFYSLLEDYPQNLRNIMT
jgi:hypothetical protein